MINFNIKFKRERGFVTILALGEPLEIFLRYSYKAWTLFKVSAERKYFASDRTEQHKKGIPLVITPTAIPLIKTWP